MSEYPPDTSRKIGYDPPLEEEFQRQLNLIARSSQRFIDRLGPHGTGWNSMIPSTQPSYMDIERDQLQRLGMEEHENIYHQEGTRIPRDPSTSRIQGPPPHHVPNFEAQHQARGSFRQLAQPLSNPLNTPGTRQLPQYQWQMPLGQSVGAHPSFPPPPGHGDLLPAPSRPPPQDESIVVRPSWRASMPPPALPNPLQRPRMTAMSPGRQAVVSNNRLPRGKPLGSASMTLDTANTGIPYGEYVSPYSMNRPAPGTTTQPMQRASPVVSHQRVPYIPRYERTADDLAPEAPGQGKTPSRHEDSPSIPRANNHSTPAEGGLFPLVNDGSSSGADFSSPEAGTWNENRSEFPSTGSARPSAREATTLNEESSSNSRTTICDAAEKARLFSPFQHTQHDTGAQAVSKSIYRAGVRTSSTAKSFRTTQVQPTGTAAPSTAQPSQHSHNEGPQTRSYFLGYPTSPSPEQQPTPQAGKDAEPKAHTGSAQLDDPDSPRQRRALGMKTVPGSHAQSAPQQPASLPGRPLVGMKTVPQAQQPSPAVSQIKPGSFDHNQTPNPMEVHQPPQTQYRESRPESPPQPNPFRAGRVPAKGTEAPSSAQPGSQGGIEEPRVRSYYLGFPTSPSPEPESEPRREAANTATDQAQAGSSSLAEAPRGAHGAIASQSQRMPQPHLPPIMQILRGLHGPPRGYFQRSQPPRPVVTAATTQVVESSQESPLFLQQDDDEGEETDEVPENIRRRSCREEIAGRRLWKRKRIDDGSDDSGAGGVGESGAIGGRKLWKRKDGSS